VDEGDAAIMGRRTARRDDSFDEETPPCLVGGKSRHTGEISYPRRSSVSDNDERVEIEGTGTLLDFTRVLRGVPGLSNSFAIGLIRLDAGPVLNAPLVDWENDQLRKGARVVLAIGEVKRDASGNVFVGPRFRPA
jgi:uncharacterized OB-fold protein